MPSLRLVVLDDGPFVRTQLDDVRPLAATFNRFVEAVARTGQFERVRYVVPVRDLRSWEVEPALDPVDEAALEIVPTEFFAGIADYLLRSAWILPRNWPRIERTIAAADLLWLRLPASNALLALAAAHRHRVPYFGWLAGSVESVARAQDRPAPLRVAAQAVGSAYDAVSELAARRGPVLTLDGELFASAVTMAEVEATRAEPLTRRGTPWRIVWAGRMAGEKGLTDLVAAVAALLRRGVDARLVLIGDGPARPAVERALAALPPDRVEDYGYVGDRPTYMRLLRSGDLFVHPSRAEGVPKVLVEAMAAGVPVIAANAGNVRAVLGDGQRGAVVPAGDLAALGAAIETLLGEPARRAEMRERGLAWAGDHTAEAQAGRLLGWLRERFRQLDWTG